MVKASISPVNSQMSWRGATPQHLNILTKFLKIKVCFRTSKARGWGVEGKRFWVIFITGTLEIPQMTPRQAQDWIGGRFF